MPFSGKSSAATKLASKIGFKALDSDKKIVLSEGVSIDEIFANKGEIYFRQLENKWLKNLNNETPSVISTGGGMPVFYDNMEFMLQSGFVVFLNNSAKILAERSLLSNDRPLVKHVSQTMDVRIEFFQKLLFERMPYYSKAHLMVQSERELLEKVSEIIKTN